MAVNLHPSGSRHFPVFAIIIPVKFRLIVAIAVVLIFNGNPGIGYPLAVFSYVILVYLKIAGPHSVGIQVIPAVSLSLPGVGQAVPVGIVVHPASVFLGPASGSGVHRCGVSAFCQSRSKYSHQSGSG